MSAADTINKVLPNTEAMRDAVELLNAVDNDAFATIASTTCDNLLSTFSGAANNKPSSAANGSSKKSGGAGAGSTAASATTAATRQAAAQEAAIRFIIYQLTYFALNTHQAALDALTEPITSTSSTESTSLATAKAEVLAALWVEKGKDLVQNARVSVIRKVCNGSNKTAAAIAYGAANSDLNTSSSLLSAEPHIHCSTTIKMGEGSVLEIAPDTPEGPIKVIRAAQSNDFTPLGLLTLPGGATVEMKEDEAYALFSELDAIQRQMDTLFSTGQ